MCVRACQLTIQQLGAVEVDGMRQLSLGVFSESILDTTQRSSASVACCGILKSGNALDKGRKQVTVFMTVKAQADKMFVQNICASYTLCMHTSLAQSFSIGQTSIVSYS